MKHPKKLVAIISTHDKTPEEIYRIAKLVIDQQQSQQQSLQDWEPDEEERKIGEYYRYKMIDLHNQYLDESWLEEQEALDQKHSSNEDPSTRVNH